MTLADHAESELRAAGLFDEDGDYGGMLGVAVMGLVRTFAGQGHSGYSAALTLELFGRLAAGEPLGPLTGAESEWRDTVDGVELAIGLEQNVRCSHVFRENGGAFDINAVVYRESGGATFTTRESARRVTFPYTPRTRTIPAWLRRPEWMLARALRRARP